MWGSFALTVAAGVVVLAIGFAGGYAFRWYRSRIKVSLATHVQQSWLDRSVHMSITNHGNTAIILDSWTVHMPLDDLLPGLGACPRIRSGRRNPPHSNLITAPQTFLWSYSYMVTPLETHIV